MCASFVCLCLFADEFALPSPLLPFPPPLPSPPSRSPRGSLLIVRRWQRGPRQPNPPSIKLIYIFPQELLSREWILDKVCQRKWSTTMVALAVVLRRDRLKVIMEKITALQRRKTIECTRLLDTMWRKTYHRKGISMAQVWGVVNCGFASGCSRLKGPIL